MVSIKGPRSALTDFIEEHGIKIDKSQQKVKEESSIQKNKNTKRKQKRTKKSKPYELSNKDKNQNLLQNILVEKILTNLNYYELNDEHLEIISAYLSQNRRFNLEYFNFLVEKSSSKLIIYDCSEIKDTDFVINNFTLKVLELHQCGQLTNYRCNELINKMNNLEVLRITGAYLITEINLPKNLKILDLSNCNRLDNKIISEINKKYKSLDELRLSYCYKITDEIKLKTQVSNLYLDETRITENFYNIKNLKTLSLKNCQNIVELKKNYKLIENLNLENIISISQLNIGSHLKYLNIQRCYRLNDWILNEKNLNLFDKLEYLNISYLKFTDFDFLFNFKLKELDLSWCENISDELISKFIKESFLERICVFGCFNLTSKSARESYENKEKISVIGNHAETKYLIENH